MTAFSPAFSAAFRPGVGRHGAASVSYTAEATTLFAAMSSQPDATRKGHIDTLIAALKTAGVWTKMDVFYVLAAHDSQASKLNWVSPSTFTASEVATVTFETDRGWTGDGVGGYLDSGFNPTTASSPKFVQNSAHLGGWSRTAGTIAGNDVGNTNAFVNYQSGASSGSYRVNQTIGSNTSGTSGQGHTIANRSTAGATQAYRNGASIGTGSQGSTTPTNATLKIGTAGFGTFPVRQHAAYHHGSSLSAGEVSDFYTALAAYMTAVGA